MKKNIISVLTLLGVITCFSLSAQESDTLEAEDVLQMSLADLMNIQVISASKTIQTIKNVPATVNVITSQQIKERGYFTLEEALSDLPGFQFRNILGFNSYVFLRGVPSQNNLILMMVDGIQINELNSGGFYAGGQFNLADIEQIEVVYGPSSALYGTNAVSGIINIITKKPDKNGGHLSLLGGNFNTGMINFDIGIADASKEYGILLSGQYKTTEKANIAGAEGDNNWTDDMENFENDLSLSARLKAKKIDAGVVFQEKKSSMSTNFKTVGDSSLDRSTLWDIAFLNAWIKYSNTDHKKWKLNSTAYFRDAVVRPNTIDQIIMATDTTQGKQIGYYRPNHLIGVETQLDYYPVENLHFTGGIIGETETLSEGFSVTNSNSMDTPPPTPLKPPLLTNYLFSYYIQANYNIFKQLSITGGIRHDFSNYYGQVFIPRFAIVFNIDKLAVKALYNRAFRSPRPWDYSYGTGNADLMPERMESLELNISYELLKNFSFTGSVYNNLIDDKLTKEKTLIIDRWINKDQLKTTGFELSGNYHSDNLDLYANYSFNDSRDQDEIFIPEISKHTVNTGITYSISKIFIINLRANYLGKRENPFIIQSTGNNEIADALIFNGCITFTGLKNIDLMLKANNILNEKYYHPSNRFEGRYRQPQRTVLLAATYNFNMKK